MFAAVQGFRVLVEKEWLAFGHKFADRCGIGRCTDDTNERCPVFLQWLDAVHQLHTQNPRVFQFNQTFLVSAAPTGRPASRVVVLSVDTGP